MMLTISTIHLMAKKGSLPYDITYMTAMKLMKDKYMYKKLP